MFLFSHEQKEVSYFEHGSAQAVGKAILLSLCVYVLPSLPNNSHSV